MLVKIKVVMLTQCGMSLQLARSCSSPEVSRLGFTRWVPGSCLPHPRMAGVDWSTVAWVKVGSQSQWRLWALVGPNFHSLWDPTFTQTVNNEGPNLHINSHWPISTGYSWVWQTTSWDPTGEAKSANPGCFIFGFNILSYWYACFPSLFFLLFFSFICLFRLFFSCFLSFIRP